MNSLTRAQILQLIPHAGSMCLLDEILTWDATSLSAASQRYQQRDNPLRRQDGSLGTATTVELAAQAMAAHGALSVPLGAAASAGYLVSLRDVHLVSATIPAGTGPLQIDVRRSEGSVTSARYSFSVSSTDAKWLTGWAVVLFGDLP